jgi:hypothetical protein
VFLLHGPSVPFAQAAVPPQLPHGATAPSLFDQPVADFVGLHTWQAFAGLAAPLLTKAPPIQHPVWQLPLLQTLPLPQLAPFACDPVSTHTGVPVLQATAPTRQGLGG